MKRKTEVVIIGAGVTGLGIAYQLAKRGFKDVVVIEQRYPSCLLYTSPSPRDRG